MKLKSPGHVSVGGKLYEQAKDGTVEVPEEHAAVLIESHGCKPVADPKVKQKGEPAE
jgi:hypothetical protein